MLALLSMLLAMMSESVPIEGSWVNPSGSVTVEIAPCGDAWCGTVVAASDKAKADAARGGTPDLVGTLLMTEFRLAKENLWRGRLFVPDLNRRSKADLRLLDDGTLKVRGCAVGRTICKSQIWTRMD